MGEVTETRYDVNGQDCQLVADFIQDFLSNHALKIELSRDDYSKLTEILDGIVKRVYQVGRERKL